MKSDKFAPVRLIFGLMSLMISIGLIRSIIGHVGKQDIVQTQESVLQAEQERKAELNRKLEEATSAAFIEKQAREKLGLAKPEDTIVLIDTSGVGIDDTVIRGEERASNWKRWWRLFF